jgi:hypothetical protein
MVWGGPCGGAMGSRERMLYMCHIPHVQVKGKLLRLSAPVVV